MVDLSDFAGMVTIIESYAHVIFILLIIYYTYLTIKGGSGVKVAGAAWGLGKDAGKGIAGGAKKAWKKMFKTTTKVEQWGELDYLNIKKLQDALKKLPDTGAQAELEKVLGGPKRKLVRSEKKTYRRFADVEDAVKKLKPEVQKKVSGTVKQMEIDNKMVIDQLRIFDTELANTGRTTVKSKRKTLDDALTAALTADQAFIAGAEKLKKLLASL